MFKWPGTPSYRANGHEIADYAELLCWRDGSTSTTTISEDLGRLDDNDYSAGVPEDNESDEIIDSAHREIERRKSASRGAYPFAVSNQGYTLTVDAVCDDHKQDIYKYLLLSTRLNMRDSRVHANIDGANLLEDLSAEVAREYFGHRAESLVFGTAARGSGFREKVNDLCRRLKEGGGFISQSGSFSNIQDGKLDVVVWKHFCDTLPGKIIGFGQCKTGTDYRDDLAQLQPDSFCKKWFRSPVAVDPIRMFFVSEALPINAWFEIASDGGLLFDRCRIVDFADNLSAELLAKVRTWTSAAAEATGLPR